MSHFYSLQIKQIIRETPSAVSLVFDVPQSLNDLFSFKAGQYLTLKTTIGQEEIRRAYSISSSTNSGVLKITVKEVEQGAFSVFANKSLSVGDSLDVMPPEGAFILEAHSEVTNNYLAFVAGSGITPVMSILKTVLEEEPKSSFVLVYGNKSPEECIFLSQLHKLEKKYFPRFSLELTYSRVKEEGCYSGRIDQKLINHILKNKYNTDDFKAYYLCGPEGMIRTATESIEHEGVLKENIYFELFSVAETAKDSSKILKGHTAVTIVLDDVSQTFEMSQEQTVLEAVLKNQLDPPYSCQGGVCSSCIARVKEGKAHMESNLILSDSEIEEGLILTCQAHPLTPTMVIDYDDV